MAWFVLKMRSAAQAVHFRDILTEARWRYFLPLNKQVVRRAGKDVVVEKPLLFAYVFMSGDEPDVIRFADAHEGITLLREQHSEVQPAPYLRVPEVQMQGFIHAVEMYGDKIPVVSPTPSMLAKGDKVKILSENFYGVEGILEAKQGKDGGRVIIRIDNYLAVPTIEIEAQYIEVLEFAKQGKHLYKKLDSFEPRLKQALDKHIWGEPQPIPLHDHLQVFTRRYAHLKVESPNARARFLSMLMLAYALLERRDEAIATFRLLSDLRPSLVSHRAIVKTNEAIDNFKSIVYGQ